MSQAPGRYLDELMMNVPLEEFVKKFKFDKTLAGHVRVRREWLLVNEMGSSIPAAENLIARISALHRHGSEFYPGITNCHLSARTRAVRLPRDLFDEMSAQDNDINMSSRNTEIKLLMGNVLEPQFIPPDKEHRNTRRYHMLAEQLDDQLLERAVLTHTILIEFFMQDLASAIQASNRLLPFLERRRKAALNARDEHWMNLELISGKRPIPDEYQSVQDFHASAARHGFAATPARSSHVVNISAEDGTLRLDFYACTSKLSRIVEWAEEARAIIRGEDRLSQHEPESEMLGDTAG